MWPTAVWTTTAGCAEPCYSGLDTTMDLFPWAARSTTGVHKYGRTRPRCTVGLVLLELLGMKDVVTVSGFDTDHP